MTADKTDINDSTRTIYSAGEILRIVALHVSLEYGCFPIMFCLYKYQHSLTMKPRVRIVPMIVTVVAIGVQSKGALGGGSFCCRYKFQPAEMDGLAISTE